MQDLIDTREALELLDCKSPSTISRLVAAGDLTPERKGRGRTGGYWFRRRDVERLAAKRAKERAA